MFEELLRPFWTEGLNTITGSLSSNLIDIIDSKKGYVVYDNINKQDFILKLTDYDYFLKGFASDINRFGCASIESINDIQYKSSFKKSHAWKCIKCYYAAYYSAHAFLRMLGISCTNFEQIDLTQIEQIADVYSTRNGINIEKGYYKCQLDYSKKQLTCAKINKGGNKGSHEQLWEVYLEILNYIITELKSKSPTPNLQIVILKLADLKNNLTYLGSNGGNWLSKVRNEINYKHTNGLWFPYTKTEKYFDGIEYSIKNWEQLPESMDLSACVDKPILRFLNTCIFLVSLYLTLAKEMKLKCPKGVSFQQQGVLSLLNRINSH